MSSRALVISSLVLLLSAALLSPPAAPEPLTPAGIDPSIVDTAWLGRTYGDLEARYGTDFLDVGYAARPTLHVAVLFNGPVPEDLGSLHASLDAVGYDVSSADPLTHEPIVPVMLLLAQQVPAGIRPGVWMLAPHACTMAHVVGDQLGRSYILTAGHCVDFVGQRVSLVKEGDIGSVVAFRNAGIGRDYALVRIDPQHAAKIDPSMVGWKGPVGVASVPETDAVRHYGFGSATWYAHATRCRTGFTSTLFWGASSYGFDGVVLWGDSGSGANTGSGKALGIITHLNLVVVFGNNAGTRITYALSELATMTGLTLTLADGAPQNAVCEVT